MVSKFIAVLLLPVYTRYIAPAGYGVVELLGNGVILISILVRFGMIESFLRFYFADEDQRAARRAGAPRGRLPARRRRRVAIVLAGLRRRRCPSSCSATATRRPSGSPCSACGRSPTSSWPTRCCGSTSALRAYATASLINVALTIASSVVLVVVLGHGGARACCSATTAPRRSSCSGCGGRCATACSAASRRRAPSRTGVLLRFGLPTVPAEASVYALSIVDRYYIFHHRSARRWPACTRSRSSSPARSRSSSRAFQYAWPPLAYSVSDDAEAARLYGLVTTYYLLVSGWVVAGLAAARPLGSAPAGRARLLRRLPGAAVGRARLGAVRPVGGVPGHRRPRQGDHAQLPGRARRPGRQRGAADRARARAGDRRRRHRALRRVRGDARRHAPADPPRVRGRRSSGGGWPSSRVVLGGLAVAGDLLLPTHGAVGFLTPRRGAALAMPLVLLVTGFAHPAGARAGAGAAARARRARRAPREPACGQRRDAVRRRRSAPRRPRSTRCSRSSCAAGDELILADNSGVAAARGGVAVVRASGERSPAHARNVGAAQRARRLDPVPRRRLPRSRRVCSTRLRRAGRRRRRGAGRRGRARCPAATRSPRATGRRGTSSPSRPTSTTPTGRGPSRPTCSSAAPPSSRSAASTRACGPPRTPTSAGACRRPAGGSSCAAEPRSSTATARTLGELRRQWRGYAAGRAWLARRYEGFAPEPAVAGRSGGCATARAPRSSGASARAPDQRAAPPVRRGGSSGAATSPWTRSSRPRSSPGWPCPTGRPGRRGALADVVIGGRPLPGAWRSPGRVRSALERVRVEAAARPSRLDGDLRRRAADRLPRGRRDRRPRRRAARAGRPPSAARVGRPGGPPARGARAVGAGPGRAPAPARPRRAGARARRRRRARHRPAAGPAGRAPSTSPRR